MKNFRLPAEFLRLRVHVIHELVDQRDGDLLDLGFRVGDFAHEDVPGGVDAAFGVGVEHVVLLRCKLIQGHVILDVVRNEGAVLGWHGSEIMG